MAKRNPISDGTALVIAIGVGIGVFLISRLASGQSLFGSGVVGAISPQWLAKKKPSQTQLQNAQIIEDEFRGAGQPDSVIAAALVNSWAESGWSNGPPDGDGGHSIGLFQLNDAGGAGIGLTVEYRRDPRNNTKVILEREVLTRRGNQLRQRAAEGAGVGELAAIFSRDIERPKDKEGNMAARRKLAEAMFPQMA